MAGEIRGGSSIPRPVRKVRKLWSLQDRSVVSVHLLKANLAEDGCEEAQLDVAKRLLNDSNIDANDVAAQCENARLAVYWFIKASEQGSDEATRHLQECYDSGRGITCQNILDVEACLNTPKNEKLTFKAARQLYTKLCNGEDFITTTQLHARLESKKYKTKVTFSPKSWGVSPSSPNWDGAGDAPFREHQNLEDAPLLTSDEDEKELNSSSCFNSAETEYLASIRKKNGEGTWSSSTDEKLTLEALLTVAAKFNDGEPLPASIRSSSTVLASEQWVLCTPWNAVALQFIFLAVGSKMMSLSTGMYSAVAFLAVWSAYNFILHGKRHENFEDWSEVFQSALKEEVPWTVAGPRSKFDRKYFRPYLNTNLICGLLLTFAFPDHFLANILIGTMSLFSLRMSKGNHKGTAFKQWKLHIVLISLKFFYHTYSQTFLSSSYPPLIKKYVTGFTSRIPQIHVTISGVVILAILIIAVLGAVAVTIWLKSSRRQPRRLATRTGESLESFWTFALVGWYVQCPWEVVSGQVVMMVTLLLLALHCGFESDRKAKGVFCGRLLVAVSTILFVGLYLSHHFPQGNTKEEVGWPAYQVNCHRPAWSFRSIAETQQRCQEVYLGRPVNWTGKVSYVKLKEDVDQNHQELVFELVMDVGVAKDQGSGEEHVNWNWILHRLPLIFQEKHSESLDIAPVVLVISSDELDGSLEDSEKLVAYIHSLRSGDLVQFHGILSRGLGGFKPEIGKIEQLTCISCTQAQNNGITFQFGKNNTLFWILDQLASGALHTLNQLQLYIPNLW